MRPFSQNPVGNRPGFESHQLRIRDGPLEKCFCFGGGGGSAKVPRTFFFRRRRGKGGGS